MNTLFNNVYLRREMSKFQDADGFVDSLFSEATKDTETSMALDIGISILDEDEIDVEVLNEEFESFVYGLEQCTKDYSEIKDRVSSELKTTVFFLKREQKFLNDVKITMELKLSILFSKLMDFLSTLRCLETSDIEDLHELESHVDWIKELVYSSDTRMINYDRFIDIFYDTDETFDITKRLRTKTMFSKR